MATKKKENAVPEIIDNVEALEAKMKAMREAQKKFATYTQEQVDKIFFEAAMAANKMRIPLAKYPYWNHQRREYAHGKADLTYRYPKWN